MARPRPQVSGFLSALPTRLRPSRTASSSHPRGASLRRDDVTPPLPVGLKAINEQSHHRSPSHYNAALRLAADYSFRRGQTALLRTGTDVESLGWSIARAICADAERAGIDLGRDGLEQLLRFSFVQPEILPTLLLELAQTEPLQSAYSTLARLAIASNSLEQLHLVLHEMYDRGVRPSALAVKHAVRMACESDCPRLAYDLAHRFEADSPHGKRLDSTAWASILIASAQSQYLEGVRVAWARVVPHKTFTPDEGLVLSVLAVAARWADPSLSLRALEALAAIGVTAQEHHLTLLLEAYVNAGQLPDAIRVLSAIRAAGFHPTTATAQPIVAALTTADLIDQAFYTIEDMHKAGSSVDITALNAIVAAAVRTGDLPRARATQLAAADVGLVPDKTTYNLVLAACVTANNRLLGDRILSEMRSASLSPDATSYEHMIQLCLQSPEYEAAFFYFEKLKAEAQPRREIYQALFNACARRDDRRWKLVQEEAQRAGFRLTRRETPAEPPQPRPRRPQRS